MTAYPGWANPRLAPIYDLIDAELKQEPPGSSSAEALAKALRLVEDADEHIARRLKGEPE